MKVLYIDDDEDMGEIVTIKLQQKGLDVVYTNSSLEGIEMFNPEIYTALIVDHFMPEIDGMELITRLQEKFGKINAIMLSGAETKEMREKVSALGAKFVVKEFSPEYIDRIYSYIVKKT